MADVDASFMIRFHGPELEAACGGSCCVACAGLIALDLLKPNRGFQGLVHKRCPLMPTHDCPEYGAAWEHFFALLGLALGQGKLATVSAESLGLKQADIVRFYNMFIVVSSVPKYSTLPFRRLVRFI